MLVRTCEADGTLEGSSHSLEAVLDQMALELGGRVEGLAAELAFVVQALLCRRDKGQTHGSW